MRGKDLFFWRKRNNLRNVQKFIFFFYSFEKFLLGVGCPVRKDRPVEMC